MSNFTSLNESSKWNTFEMTIDGIAYTIPGASKVSVSVSRVLKKEKADTEDGESVTDVGSNASSVSVSTTMSGWEYEEFCQQILPALKIKGSKGKEKNPIICNHPQLSAVGIQKILIEGIELPSPYSGVTEVSLSFTEWSEPKKQKKSSSKSSFGIDSNGNPIPDPGIAVNGISSQSTYGEPLSSEEILEQYESGNVPEQPFGF
jgi:hypothetical protein